jgi:hypothetical protein
MFDVPATNVVPAKEGVAFHYYNMTMQKFKMYRYDPENSKQVNWLDQITEKVFGRKV